ncbi:MAG: peptide chain release factor N(5)-glutamine methyltransferase [Bacteroidales bacterium]|nr:peptide chain release factor N(5)-glutamine methyltransferase [Bacteroidales bacterium]
MQYHTNILGKIKSQIQRQLTDIYDEREAGNLVSLLVEHYFGISRSELALQPDYRLSESEILQLHFAAKRLLQHEPIQYILEQASFFGLRLYVTPSVLIPRQETESLVSEVLSSAKPNTKILDIGTGSGCIALALKSKLPNAEVSALDVSESAIEIAEKNARETNLKILLIQDDILNPKRVDQEAQFDIIVSNPPYVTEKDKSQMNANVLLWEPGQALYVTDEDPLLFYQHISDFARKHLTTGGQLYFEINENFGTETVHLLTRKGFTDVVLLPDLNGKDRFVKAVFEDRK